MISKLEPFNPKTPFIDPKTMPLKSGAIIGGVYSVSQPMQKWLAQIPQRLNATPLITGIVPTNSSSKGIEGQLEFDDSYVYFYKNGKWRRAAAGLF
jgi:hypothetical protein